MSDRILVKAVVPKRKNEWGEWHVKAYDQEGKRWPEADYFTDDREDALATAEAMIQPENSFNQ